MNSNKQKIVIKENKKSDIARFFISYSLNRSKAENKERSFQIISALVKDHDIIMELDSSLIVLNSAKEKETSVLGIVKDLRELGIDYRYQKSESPSNSRSLLDLFSFNKNVTVHKVLAHIPNKTWKEADLLFMLPTYGVRYYIFKETIDGANLLEDIYCGRITEAEKKDYFDYIIYDCSDFGQMGLNSDISKEELRKALEV